MTLVSTLRPLSDLFERQKSPESVSLSLSAWRNVTDHRSPSTEGHHGIWGIVWLIAFNMTLSRGGKKTKNSDIFVIWLRRDETWGPLTRIHPVPVLSQRLDSGCGVTDSRMWRTFLRKKTVAFRQLTLPDNVSRRRLLQRIDLAW